jgi:hypothetical protein
MSDKPQRIQPAMFSEVSVLLGENGWVIIEGMSENGGYVKRKWIAKTPQDIAAIFTKYSNKPNDYQGSK